MTKKIRYAVVGLGHIAQVAVLPAFKNARKNSELVALVSSDPKKLTSLGKKYDVPNLFDYSQFDEALDMGLIDAIYIATPNVMHTQFALAAAKKGVHILTEKPMAQTEEDCSAMLKAARAHRVKLMVGYRLHFDPANLKIIEMIRAKKIGETRIFSSTFTHQIKDRENIRLKKAMGGGPMWDIGIYCLNASRYLFEEEPTEVFAMTSSSPTDSRFSEVEEMMAVTLRFPKDRLANFSMSFGAAESSSYDIIGTKGRIRLDNAYEYADETILTTHIGEKEKVRKFKKHDQFAPELVYFSDCILQNREPEPSAEEGLLDVRIIEAIYESAKTGKPVSLKRKTKTKRPGIRQALRKPPVRKPDLVHARSSS